MSKIIAVLAVGRERTEEEKQRRHLYGDRGAKFSKGKRLCLMGGVSGCVTTFATKDNLVCEIYNNMENNNQINLPEELRGKKFRIRKLTPRETGRLMGLRDEEIDLMFAAGLSNSSMYKLHGNSIVVDVLFHLFRKLFVETGPDKTDEPEQLTLF